MKPLEINEYKFCPILLFCVALKKIGVALKNLCFIVRGTSKMKTKLILCGS
jgi:hypothetical protein